MGVHQGAAVVAVGGGTVCVGGAPGGIRSWRMSANSGQPVSKNATAISAAVSAVSVLFLFLAFIAVSDLIGFRCERNWTRAK